MTRSLQVFLTVAGLAMTATSTMAQTSYPQCQPPKSGEYLLLVLNKTSETQSKVRSVLPNNADATVCNYLENVVTRVSGFSSVETANSWAQYLTQTVGLQAFVARSTQTPTATRPPEPAPLSAKASDPSTYNPQPLGTGYAVLVSYFDRPELAGQVQQALSKEVGLVSYGQRPYLLAIQTTDQAIANSTLQKLSDRGFWAMVVDSRRVTLLRSAVSVPAIGGR
ncbi:hypothetical protein ACKFKG_18050 [Phormidesmis sp. 146-35]